MCGMLPRSGVSQGNNRRNLYLSLAAFTYVHVHVPVCSVSTIQYDPATKLTADSLQSLEFPCHVYLMTDFLECVYRSSAVFIGGCRWSSEISSQWNMASKKSCLQQILDSILSAELILWIIFCTALQTQSSNL